ncbi:hypothetical protein WALSEDRAFT_61658 [Wallemia mellicola CBS 633.66]|uniref:Uncharacterized protein n=1 Tax=Wallemia mellicola (strain ATCC MYA-4683 / CBS 633.66) TaxID=671144 RepID=I4Y515_WALMC|nr:hypothetical protein WALSEDRAFT_61658 [Wallemia mellicola CBS 633.66]EIM19057.1 hypothetical protein WALSEDRAFT_61658 [Wallemia mellicola CBS 633.66]|eukprot:XP_006960900.1 hypothetical protein WALSEDRAFT_61658 [Wallemia mellicola CBS 633.66]
MVSYIVIFVVGRTSVFLAPISIVVASESLCIGYSDIVSYFYLKYLCFILINR